MSNKTLTHAARRDIKHTAKIYRYPCGIMDIIASSEPDFGPGGWEDAEDWSRAKRLPPMADEQEPEVQERGAISADAESCARSMRRARAKVRRLALANDFKWFVTLTLDPAKVDTKEGAAVVKKLNAWASNAVQRHGLQYILVPERHKKGGIHFHGFFNDALEMVDSGTLRAPWAKRPRKPRSKAERAAWLAHGARVVYNVPGWGLGFSTAMELHGEYPAAVAYVCKYIGKDGEKPAGRWYYSGGGLAEPSVEYTDLSVTALETALPGKCFAFPVPGRKIAVVNGLKMEVSNEGICGDLRQAGGNGGADSGR
jgi:hypothetical protein